MPIARALKQYLDTVGIPYSVQPHVHAESSMETAEAAHISGHRIAKGILLKDDMGYLLAVLPSNRHVDADALDSLLGGRMLKLADQEEVATIFSDCEPGAIPAVGEPYHLEVAMDESLCEQSEIHFKAGEHNELIRLSGEAFQKLLAKAKRGRFAQ